MTLLDSDSNKLAEIFFKGDSREHLTIDKLYDDTEESLLSFEHGSIIKVVAKILTLRATS